MTQLHPQLPIWFLQTQPSQPSFMLRITDMFKLSGILRCADITHFTHLSDGIIAFTLRDREQGRCGWKSLGYYCAKWRLLLQVCKMDFCLVAGDTKPNSKLVTPPDLSRPIYLSWAILKCNSSSSPLVAQNPIKILSQALPAIASPHRLTKDLLHEVVGWARAGWFLPVGTIGFRFPL